MVKRKRSLVVRSGFTGRNADELSSIDGRIKEAEQIHLAQHPVQIDTSTPEQTANMVEPERDENKPDPKKRRKPRSHTKSVPADHDRTETLSGGEIVAEKVSKPSVSSSKSHTPGSVKKLKAKVSITWSEAELNEIRSLAVSIGSNEDYLIAAILKAAAKKIRDLGLDQTVDIAPAIKTSLNLKLSRNGTRSNTNCSIPENTLNAIYTAIGDPLRSSSIGRIASAIMKKIALQELEALQRNLE